MSGVSKIQQELFSLIKANAAPHSSIIEEIARVLNISTDRVYRRMRGEKEISLDELQALCAHYNISVDRVLNLQPDGFVFQGNFIDDGLFSFDKYVESMVDNLTYFNKFQQKDFYGTYKDIPNFYHFQFREIAAFKDFVWQRNVLHLPEFKNKRFSFAGHPSERFAKEEKALDLYNRMNNIEIWSLETINSMIRQIEYFKDSLLFESIEDAYRLYGAVEKLINHIEEQAALGYKFKYGDPARKPLGEYSLYINEMQIGGNEYLLILDGKKIAVIVHSAINYMMTRNVAFTENMYRSMQSFIKRSTLISGVSEKERSRFFRILREKISRKKHALAH
jgi:transcriptional regulator with XRE-family HTH domain